jgi:hypothetical protein
LRAIQLDLVKINAIKKPFKDDNFYSPGKPFAPGFWTKLQVNSSMLSALTLGCRKYRLMNYSYNFAENIVASYFNCHELLSSKIT